MPGVPSGDAARTSADRAAERRRAAAWRVDRDLLHGLPQPLHLFTLAARCHHYHFGQFVDPGERLATAMHRTSVACATHLSAAARVLDVGCGLGGSTRIFHRLGHTCVGIDPCEASIRYARGTVGEGAGLRFERSDFASAIRDAGRSHEGFDGFVFLEVLQHLPSLDDLLDRALSVSRPRATMVFSDLFALPELPWASAPFHRREALAVAARHKGLDVVVRRGLTPCVLPTLDRLLARLAVDRERMVACFEPGRPRIREEIAELADQCRHLRRALETGDLVYELVVLRRP